MWKKAILVIALVIIFFLVQENFLPATNTFLSSINIIIMSVIWLSFIGSNWSWWFAILGGLLLDLEQGLMGVNTITYLLLVNLVLFLRVRIATTGRLTQFFSISLISLVGGMIFQYIFSWLGAKLVPELFSLAQNGLAILISFNQVIQLIVVNLAVLLICYSLFRKKLAI